MAEVIIKADVSAIRRWLVSIAGDTNMPDQDRWLAKQTLEYINK